MINKQMIFAVPAGFSIKKLGELLSDRLEARIERDEDIHRAYLDTFDWRLYRSGMVLEVECRGGLYLLLLRELNSGKPLFNSTARKPPKSAEDFHAAGMQPVLKRIIGRRSLIAHVSLRADADRLLLLNKDEKTVMRVELRHDYVVSPKNSDQIAVEKVIYLFPYRGYETEFMDRWRWAIRDAKFIPAVRDPLLLALDALKITPGLYTSRPAFTLDNAQPALAALVQILKRFLQVIDDNVEGARNGDDPEYLHDLLVAVRRTTIFLGGFSALFPAENLELMKHGFQWIEQEATPIRDLDIYLSLFDDFETRVDADHRQALHSLYNFLQEQKRREIRRMRISLDSPRYFRLIESWKEFLQDCQDLEQAPKAAMTPIGDLARGRIWDIYSELVRNAKGLGQGDNADEICVLHQISKHLGYHLDVFSSLFPAKKMGKLLKAHDRLQSSLNQFRDMNLQNRRLREYMARMKEVQAVRKISLEAVEQLIADRQIQKAKAREEVIYQVEKYTRKKMRKRYRSMLAVSDKGSDV